MEMLGHYLRRLTLIHVDSPGRAEATADHWEGKGKSRGARAGTGAEAAYLGTLKQRKGFLLISREMEKWR